MTGWTTAPLGEQHDLLGFDCGAPVLNGWFTGHAMDAARRGTARTYVWTGTGELLHDALTRTVQAADVASGRLIVVDAIDDMAAKFYQRYDFQPVKDNPRRLVNKVATVRDALG